MFSTWNKLHICYRCDTMLAVHFWYNCAQEWKLHTSFHSINKQILCYTRKILLFSYATCKRYLYCDSIRISSDRNNIDFMYNAYLRNVQNCQVNIFIHCIDRYNYSLETNYYIFISEITKYIILRICSYRFQTAMLTSTLQSINVMNEFVIYRRIFCAIDIHRQAMELVSIQCDAYIVIYEIYNYEKYIFLFSESYLL